MDNRTGSKLYLFGAGGWGRAFLNGKKYDEYEKKYDEIAFYDNNLSLPDSVYGKYRIEKKMWEIITNKDVLIITSGYWNEIYEECIFHGIEAVNIYDGNRDVICSYAEMCIQYKVTYSNAGFVRYHVSREKEINQSVEHFMNGEGGIFENMTQVAIMLSNLCNYASIHSKCPANSIKDKEIMPSKNVYRILNELADSMFNGIICFHVYNEPMMDPRLFMFIKYIKEKILKAKIMIYSNGYYLNKVMMEELREVGIDTLIVTGYGEDEFKRLIALDSGKLSYKVLWGNLDDRLEFYEKTDNANCGVCRANLFQVAIFSNGDIGTCCLDHRHSYNLGNVITTSLKEVVNSPKMHEFQKRLLNGDRMMYSICQACGWNL